MNRFSVSKKMLSSILFLSIASTHDLDLCIQLFVCVCVLCTPLQFTPTLTVAIEKYNVLVNYLI